MKSVNITSFFWAWTFLYFLTHSVDAYLGVFKPKVLIDFNIFLPQICPSTDTVLGRHPKDSKWFSGIEIRNEMVMSVEVTSNLKCSRCFLKDHLKNIYCDEWATMGNMRFAPQRNISSEMHRKFAMQLYVHIRQSMSSFFIIFQMCQIFVISHKFSKNVDMFWII